MLQINIPGKLIISGEHAVVYGSPALAAAIDRYVHIQLAPAEEDAIQFAVTAFQQQPLINIPISELPERMQELRARYLAFTQGKLAVNQIISQVYDLPLYTIGLFYEHMGIPFTQGVRLTVSGDLPIGYGLGSSAAVIVAILRVLCQFFAKPLSSQELHALAIQVENLQHGYSSGLDPSVCLHAGVILYNQKNIQPRSFAPWPAYLINTGQPLSSTGECVEKVKIHASNQSLWEEFAAVTLACDQALQNQETEKLYRAIAQNHQLLCQLGVVPQRIQEFIAQLEQVDSVAKICGAGSVRGDNCGYLLVLADESNLGKVDEICKRFGFVMERVQLGVRG